MTEAEFLASSEPQKMLAFLLGTDDTPWGDATRWQPSPSPRKLRLFGVAACRTMWSMLHSKPRRAVEVAERFADGLATAAELDASHRECSAFAVADPDAARGAQLLAIPTTTWPVDGAELAALLREIVGNPFRPATWSLSLLSPMATTVLSLASAAYDERVKEKCEKCHGKGGWCRCPGCHGEWAGDVGPDCFVCGHPRLTREGCPDCHGTGTIETGHLDNARLAVLSDALEEAGAEGEILAHLRSPGSHVRGCHVLDLLLGKS